jgi:hypothetical protein
VELFHVAAIFPIVDGYEGILSTLLVEDFDSAAFHGSDCAGEIESDMLILEQNGRGHFAGIGGEFTRGEFLYPRGNVFVRGG